MTIQNIFSDIKTIAIVGLSDNAEKPSYEVGMYLQSEGFRIIPVNPNVMQVLGEKAYPTLSDIPREIHIDVVDVFRRSEFVFAIVKEVLLRGDAKTIWLQEGISNSSAETYATEHGLTIISNFCLMKAHQKNGKS